jgi:hypothetical protein
MGANGTDNLPGLRTNVADFADGLEGKSFWFVGVLTRIGLVWHG